MHSNCPSMVVLLLKAYPVIDEAPQLLLATTESFCRLDRVMPKQELGLIAFTAGEVHVRACSIEAGVESALVTIPLLMLFLEAFAFTGLLSKAI